MPPRIHLRPPWRHPALALSLLLTTALCASLALSAAGTYELAGLQLGEDRAAVLRAHPELRLEALAYEDPLVGTDYAVTFGRIAILRYEGALLVRQSPEAAYDLTVRLTGDERLYAVVTLVSDAGRTCREAVEEGARRYGEPRIDERPFYVLWGSPSMLGPQVEFRCLGEGLYRLELSDLALARDYEDQLAAELQSAVHETLQAARETTRRPAELPPPRLLPPRHR
jgi:hypothetical protein